MIYVAPDMLPKHVVSDAQRQRSPFRDQTITVSPVTGVGSSSTQVLFGSLLTGTVARTSIVWTETFREALIETLQDARLFSAVTRDNDARYRLQADIVRQFPTRYSAGVTVHYTLMDVTNGHVVWDDIIGTIHELKDDPIIVLGTSEFVALMRACGGNIATAVHRIASQP